MFHPYQRLEQIGTYVYLHKPYRHILRQEWFLNDLNRQGPSPFANSDKLNQQLDWGTDE